MTSSKGSWACMRSGAITAVVVGIVLGIFNPSHVWAQDAGRWESTPAAQGASGTALNCDLSQMIPLPDLSDCDACDLRGIPTYESHENKSESLFGDRIRVWWEEHARNKCRHFYYQKQECHRCFFNPVMPPSGPPYGFHAKTWSPFPERFCALPPALHGVPY